MLPSLSGSDFFGFRVRAFVVADLSRAAALAVAAGDPWPVEAIQAEMCRPNCAGLVAESGDEIAALAVYSFDRTSCGLSHLLLAPGYGQSEAGSAVLIALTRLAGDSDRLVRADVSEAALQTQMLLRRNGFRCDRVTRDSDGVTYRFVWTAYWALIAPAR